MVVIKGNELVVVVCSVSSPTHPLPPVGVVGGGISSISTTNNHQPELVLVCMCVVAKAISNISKWLIQSGLFVFQRFLLLRRIEIWWPKGGRL